MTHNGNYRVGCLQSLGKRTVPYPEVPQKSSTISLNGNLKVRRGHCAERIAKEAISQNTLNEGAFLSSTACCKLSAASCISLCPISNPHSAIRNPTLGWLGFCTSKKPQKLRINSQTRLKDISFKFMYVTVLLIKIVGYSFL